MAWRGGVTRKYIRNRVYRLGERKRLCRAAMLLFRVLEISTVKWLINSDGWPWFSNIAEEEMSIEDTRFTAIYTYITLRTVQFTYSSKSLAAWKSHGIAVSVPSASAAYLLHWKLTLKPCIRFYIVCDLLQVEEI